MSSTNDGDFLRALVISLVVIVGGAVAAFLAFGIFVVNPPERKARVIADTQNSYSREQWIAVFNESKELHRKEYRGEEMYVGKATLAGVLTDLGYPECRLRSDRVEFSYGGGYIHGPAVLKILLGSPSDTWQGIRYFSNWSEGESWFDPY